MVSSLILKPVKIMDELHEK